MVKLILHCIKHIAKANIRIIILLSQILLKKSNFYQIYLLKLIEQEIKLNRKCIIDNFGVSDAIASKYFWAFLPLTFIKSEKRSSVIFFFKL